MMRRTILCISLCCFLPACAAEWPGKVPEDVIERAMHRDESPDNYKAFNEQCDVADQVLSNTIFSYHDQRHGVTLDVPYNIAWVDRKGAPLSPIDFEPDAVHFGARRWVYNEETDNCEPVRDFSYQPIEKRSFAQARNFYRETYNVENADFSEETINGHRALVIRNIGDDCPFTAIEIIGPRENILMTLSCQAQGSVPNAAETLRTIVRTMDIEEVITFKP